MFHLVYIDLIVVKVKNFLFIFLSQCRIFAHLLAIAPQSEKNGLAADTYFIKTIYL